LGRSLAYVLIAVVLASVLTVSTSATTQILQTATTRQDCPTYQTNLIVIRVDSTPHEPTNTQVGQTVVTIFHVTYPDGTPVVLSPQTASFLWTGSSGKIEFDNVQVASTGQPGFYNYTATLTSSIVQATGQGVITISVAFCSCSDGSDNHGPTGNVNSIITSDSTDNSQVASNPVTTTTTQIGPIITGQDVLLLIAALLIIALLLLLILSRRRPKK
jgi:hypothetical protein